MILFHFMPTCQISTTSGGLEEAHGPLEQYLSFRGQGTVVNKNVKISVLVIKVV